MLVLFCLCSYVNAIMLLVVCYCHYVKCSYVVAFVLAVSWCYYVSVWTLLLLRLCQYYVDVIVKLGPTVTG